MHIHPPSTRGWKEEERKRRAVHTRRCVPGAQRPGQRFDAVAVFLINFPAAAWLREWRVMAKAGAGAVPRLPRESPAPPARAAPRTRARGQCCGQAGWHGPAGGLLQPREPQHHSPFSKDLPELCTSNGMFLMGIRGEQSSLSMGSVLLRTVFWRAFPTFSECWWFGGSIKRNPGTVLMLPSTNCTGRTSICSLRSDVCLLCFSCCSSYSKWSSRLFKISNKFYSEFLGKVLGVIFSPPGRFAYIQPLQPRGPSVMAFTSSTSAGWTGQPPLCFAGTWNQTLVLVWLLLLQIANFFFFLTHQIKSPDRNLLHLCAQHPAADLSSAKEVGRDCGALEKGWERTSAGHVSPRLPAQQRKKRRKAGNSAPAQQPL